MIREELVEMTGIYDLLFADGFDDAIIGVADSCGELTVVAYSTQKCIEILTNQGMSEEGDWEYFNFNVLGSYMGANTPVFVFLYEKA